MSGALGWGAAAAMLAVAAWYLIKITRLARTRRPGKGHQTAHLVMALAMAAMFAGWVSSAWNMVLLIGFAVAAAWMAVEVARRRKPTSARLCVDSFAMAVMAWAMIPPTRAGGPSMPGMSGPGVTAMPMAGMNMAGQASGDPLRIALLAISLALSVGMTAWALRGRRPADAVMGGAMALMLGSML